MESVLNTHYEGYRPRNILLICNGRFDDKTNDKIAARVQAITILCLAVLIVDLTEDKASTFQGSL